MTILSVITCLIFLVNFGQIYDFCDFHDFGNAVATVFLEISKISKVNFEIHSFSFYLKKNLFSSNTNSCPRKLNLGYKQKDFSAMLVSIHSLLAIYRLFMNETKMLYFHAKLQDVVLQNRNVVLHCQQNDRKS